MKLSKKIKVFGSLASFALLGGIAITAASCSDTSTSDKASSPDTDKIPAQGEGSTSGAKNAKSDLEEEDSSTDKAPPEPEKKPESAKTMTSVTAPA